jgi:hypothetical protein
MGGRKQAILAAWLSGIKADDEALRPEICPDLKQALFLGIRKDA